MNRFLPLLFVAAAAGGSYLAANIAADVVERETQSEINRVLSDGGYTWASIEVDGLAVQMTGEAPDEASRFAALSAAGGIVDARRIANEMTVADAPELAPPPFEVEILRNDDGISLIGLVPAGLNTDQITERARAAANGTPVTDLLETARYPAPEGWDEALRFGLDALGDLPRAKVSISAGAVAISAVTTAPDEKRELETKLTSVRPKSVTLTLDISAPRPVIAPFTLRFVLNDQGARFDACSADSEDAQAQILSAAEAAGLSGATDCQLGLGAPSRQWGTAAAAGIQAVHALGGGTLTMSNADVSLISLEGVDQATFDDAVGTLDQALPGLFALTAIRTEAPEADPEPTAAPEFSATVSPEGLVNLRGRLATEQSQMIVASYAAAQFGSVGLSPATRVDPTLPTGWSNRVLAALEALGKLENGAVTVGLETVAISGLSGRQDASAEVARILSDRLQDGADFDIDVTYSEALDPLAALPTPEECVASINAILAEEKITFAPSSSDIDPSGRAVLDKIADILRDCSAARMEIAGHTDSQGRESMNLSLSQARADAVMNAILARRVSVANLSAQGYGEATPIASNDTAEGREANRRIEFTLLSADGHDEDHADHAEESPETENEEATE